MTAIRKIRLVRIFSAIAFSVLFLGLGVLLWQVSAAPEPTAAEAVADGEIEELEREIEQLIGKLREAQDGQAGALQESARLAEELSALQKENTELRATLNKLKEEMREAEARQQNQLKRLQGKIEKLSDEAGDTAKGTK